MKKIGIILILLLISLLVYLGYPSIGDKKNQDNKVYKAKIGIYEGEPSMLLIIAQKQGFLKKENLDIEFKLFKSGKDAMDAMQNGKVDYANGAEFVAIKNSFKKQDFKILASMCEASVNGMLGKKSKNINNPIDIKGKRVGTSFGTAAEHYVGIFLKQHGLTLDDIELINIHPTKLDEALSQNIVDIIFTWEPNIYNLRKKYLDTFTYFPMPIGFPFYFTFSVNDSFHKNNPIVSSKILNAMYKAKLYLNSNPVAAKNIMKKRFKHDDEYIKYSLSKHNFNLTLPYSIQNLMRNEVNWLIRNKLVKNTSLNIDNLFDAKPLKEIDYSSVTIIE